jgi:hypothetical protein
MMTFYRKFYDGAWHLSPSLISVRLLDDATWGIFVGDCPMQARYSSAQGAKLDAWQFAVAKRKALFDYRIRLVEDEPERVQTTSLVDLWAWFVNRINLHRFH